MASGNTLQIFTPLQATYPATNFATLDLRNNQPVLDFDGVTDEEAYFEGHLPANYNNGGLSVDLYIKFSSATTGTSRWQGDFERKNAGGHDSDADSFSGVFQSVACVPNATSGITTKCTLAFLHTDLDGLLADEPFRFKVRRDADGTSGVDDITTDAEVERVVIRET